MRTIVTIGVYGATLDAFLAALRGADVGQLIDIRQRRGVRGTEYSWANAKHLQAALAEAGIDYRHRKELAPTTELRHIQYREDDLIGAGKRSRERLAPEFVECYVRQILEQVELGPIVAELPADSNAALLCVERDPEACHRSLVADRFAELGFEVLHLRP